MDEDRQEFLKIRKTFVGGSDCASIMGVGDYSCALKVFNDKTGVEPDFPDFQSKSAMRGQEMEDYVAALYTKKTGRKLTKIKSMRMEGKPYLGVSMDRIVHYEDGSQGYLEIKTLGYWSWKKVKDEGLYDEYILQVQHGMRVTGLKKGSFAIFTPEIMKGDGWDLLYWDFEPNIELADAIEDKATDFWKLHVEHKIEPNGHAQPTKACENCIYRIRCWNTANIELPKKPRKTKGKKDESVTDSE